MTTTTMNLEVLRKEIPYKWRVQSYSTYGPVAQCVAYIDARDVMDLLDTAVGIGKWQDDYRVVDGKLFAGVGILIDGEWIWKWDTGTESQTEKDKGKVSDSFKRAAVKWGIGRFLYSLEMKKVKASETKTKSNKPYPIDNSGKRIYNITDHINNLSKQRISLPATEKTPSKKVTTESPKEAPLGTTDSRVDAATGEVFYLRECEVCQSMMGYHKKGKVEVWQCPNDSGERGDHNQFINMSKDGKGKFLSKPKVKK